MQVLYVRPNTEPDRGGTHCVATIDIEFSHDLRMYGLRLLRMADGQFRLFAPQAGTRKTATFAADTAARLTDMALRALEDSQ